MERKKKDGLLISCRLGMRGKLSGMSIMDFTCVLVNMFLFSSSARSCTLFWVSFIQFPHEVSAVMLQFLFNIYLISLTLIKVC